MNDAPGAALELPSWRVERICHDEAGLLVVDKIAGIPVHGGDESLRHSLVERLTSYRNERSLPTYLGVHSRLDQDTTGLLLFTTDESRNREVQRAIEEKTLERTYVAVVTLAAGAKFDEAGLLEVQLREEKERSIVVPRGGKLARTRYRIVRRSGSRALLELSLETGRMHQIRATLAHVGAPVLGDRLYGGEPHGRLHLHATRLAGGPLPRPVESAPPPYFDEALTGSSSLSAAGLGRALADAALLRAPLLESTNAFRLVNGEGDALPGLTIDVYGTAVTVNVYDERYLRLGSELEEFLRSLGARSGYRKSRVRADLRKQDPEELAPPGPWFGTPVVPGYSVVENGMRIGIELDDGLSTGLFLDQRDHRRKARAWCRGGEVLNLFCYTGSFSVATALAGARTVSVDLSGRALERARANFAWNALPLEGHSFVKEDAMKYLGRAVKRERRFDLVILDPPSFATVGKGTFSVRQRYEEAAVHCLRLLRPGGRLLCVTNHEKTSEEAFRRMLLSAADSARVDARVQTTKSQLDCPPSSRGPFPSKSLLVTIP